LTVAFLFGQGGFPSLPVSAETVGVADAETAVEFDTAAVLLEGLTACTEAIDLQNASLSPAALGRIYAALRLDRPELFHVAPRLSYGYTETDGIRTVTEVYPVYTITGERLTAARAFYRETVAAILTEMEAVFGNHPRTEADTVLYLHDLLADRYAYDTRPEGETDGGDGGAANADAYTFFRDGTGLCQAYALAFSALCEGAGLEAHTVVSDAMDHAWNHVRVDGAWYHVDVTRDDPIPTEGGSSAVHHARLLRSDGGMEALGYHGYSCAVGHTCTDIRFERAEGGAVLENFTQRMRFWGGGWIGMDDSGAVVAVILQKSGIFIGEVGDVDRNGALEPADLLAVYDPVLPEEWRNQIREGLTKGA
jgi:transglutaminase-like putative cysteine protease